MSGKRGRPLLLTRPWLLAAVGVLAAMAACILLGMWQYHRYEGKSERAHRIERNYAATPVPLADVLPAPRSALAPSDQWRTVRLRGRYCTDPACVLYVRNRPFNGVVGFAQLVPLRTDRGTFMVARGWVPTQESSSRPQSPPAPPTDEVSVVVRVRPTEPVLSRRRNPAGQIQSIAPAEFLSHAGAPAAEVYTGAYGEMVSESPPAAVRPTGFEKPDTSLGPHLSYAVQWWLFAAFFPVAWVVRGRRAVLDARSSDDGEQPDAASPPAPEREARAERGAGSGDGDRGGRVRSRGARDGRPRLTAPGAPRRRSQDEEEEDALVDQHRR